MSAAVASQTRVPRVVAVLALSIFVLGTSEFMITGLLPEMARDLAVSIRRRATSSRRSRSA